MKGLKGLSFDFLDMDLNPQALDAAFDPEHHEAMFAMEMPGKELPGEWAVSEQPSLSASWLLEGKTHKALRLVFMDPPQERQGQHGVCTGPSLSKKCSCHSNRSFPGHDDSFSHTV